MNCYEENRCRICPKTFCCRNCRYLHEENFHKINPDCEICIYGRTTIKGASVSLLNHIRTAHWPLHCVFCKKIFSSLDELVPHDKCSLRIEMLKTEVTPKTPVTPVADKEEPSPEVTPFYKSLKTCDKKLSTWAVTSTPLVHWEEKADISQINCIYKSNLKLTGSSNLSDSKKSEKRVTFSETPSVSEFSKKPKYLPMANKIDDDQEENVDTTDESYTSMDEEDKEDIFKTAPSSLRNEENDNIDNKILVLKENCDYSGSLWESALTKLDFNGSSVIEPPSQINVSVQINVFNNTTAKSDDSANLSNNSSIEEASVHSKPKNIWSSMTDMVKSVIQNVSMTAQNSFSNAGVKRPQPETDTTEVPSFKRMKLTDIKCRRTIREISPFYQYRLAKPRCVDKATQTDECWL